MDVVHPRCAGIDCSKKDAKVCIRVQGQGRRRASSMVTTWGATTSQILALREHLIAEKVTCVVIESTSDYWRPFYYLLDDALNMMLVNASRVRNVPDRKTDLIRQQLGNHILGHRVQIALRC
jgi:transposase